MSSAHKRVLGSQEDRPPKAPRTVKKERITVIGSGNWGSVAARIAAQNALRNDDFEDEVRMWVFEEMWEGKKLSGIINDTHMNPKYLPGVNLGSNLKAVPDLPQAVHGATMLIFVTPHQFIKRLTPQIKSTMAPDAHAISLIKGMDVTEDGFQLISSLIEKELGIDCSVLMGANIANEIAKESFSEATVGYKDGHEKSGQLWQRVFHTNYFNVSTVPDPVGCELCGTLKNIVALGAGFVDGLDLGNNTKAAIIRIGLLEMRRLAQQCFPSVKMETLFESAGIADLITTCFGGRNRQCSEAFVRAIRDGRPKSFDEIEKELLGGQKLQGVLTSHEVQAILRVRGLEKQYPLFTTINRIVNGSVAPESIVRYAEMVAAERVFLFSSESVNEGHPDKLCDQVSDAILDACLRVDPKSKVACETACKDNMVMVAGEITTQAKIDYEKVVRGVVAKIGFDSFEDDLSSVDSKGLSDKTCQVLVRINKQSPDIAGGVHVGKEDLDIGAGDQGIMFGYASDETEDCMPLTHAIATRLGKKLTDTRKSGELWWLRPDGKTQVTIQYLQKADGSVEPLKIHTVVISTQHAEPLKATRRKEVPGYTGPDETAPSMEEMKKLIEERVIQKTLSEIMLKSGKPASSLYGSSTHLHVQPSGKFIIGGPQGDAGLTGRKIIIDTYGGWGAHGGGAFSGKDPTKVDRSAAYICRQMAKSAVKSGLCARCLVQLSYAIGVAKPLSLFVETYGTEKGALTVDDITGVLKIEFDCRPGAIAASLALREPKYQETAAYCHFGREPYLQDGIKYFEWENAKDLTKYRSMSSSDVKAALHSSNYLVKWVD